MDVHVRSEIIQGLIHRGVDVTTSQEDDSAELEDSELLSRASALGRVLFSQDRDLLAEAVIRQRNGVHFAGVVYAHQLRITIGQAIADLELIAKAMDIDELADRIIYLPFR